MQGFKLIADKNYIKTFLFQKRIKKLIKDTNVHNVTNMDIFRPFDFKIKNNKLYKTQVTIIINPNFKMFSFIKTDFLEITLTIKGPTSYVYPKRY